MGDRTFYKKYDVIVIGGGMAGICAAMASSRHGARTALIHNRPVLGGNASSEIRMHICGADCNQNRPDARETGIIEEILLENRKRNPIHSFSVFDMVLWEYVDIFIPSFDEAEKLTGECNPEGISKVFMDFGAGAVVIKLGDKGCYLNSAGCNCDIPPYNVNIVDCTGAGDAFVSDFVAAFIRNRPLVECGRFANAAGALCVQSIGATTGMRAFDDIQELLKGFTRSR